MADEHVERGNPALLKGDIQAGRTGDKIGGSDPGAAPLGTDSEAGGAPPTAGEVAQARVAESDRKSNPHQNAAQPSLQPDAQKPSNPSIPLGFALGAMAALVFGGLMWLALT